MSQAQPLTVVSTAECAPVEKCEPPSVSVVMPAFNAAAYVAEAIRSVLEQTYRDLELVIVDDGSTDATSTIAREHAGRDHRVRVISTTNRGVANARNTGIEHASADRIAFLDADDTWALDKLRRQMQFLTQHPALSAISTFGTYQGSRNQRIGVLEFGPRNHAELQRLRAHRKPVWLLTPSVLCRRSALIDLGGFDPSFHGAAEDLDLWTRLGEQFEVLALPQHLVHVRISGSSASMVHHLRIQQNTLRVRVNAVRRAKGEPTLDDVQFARWLAGEGRTFAQRWEPTWRSSFHYRRAGHFLLEGRLLKGAHALVKSFLASPRHVTSKLRTQVLPSVRTRNASPPDA